MSTFGLALSGGGFRSTLFRLDVIRLMRDTAVDTTTAPGELVSARAPFKRGLISQPEGLDAFVWIFAAIGTIPLDAPRFTRFFDLAWVCHLAIAGARS